MRPDIYLLYLPVLVYLILHFADRETPRFDPDPHGFDLPDAPLPDSDPGDECDCENCK